MIFNHCARRIDWALKWLVLRIALRKVFSHLPGGLQHFEDSSSIQENQPAIFNTSLIATTQQTFLDSFCVMLSSQYHSSRIDEAFMYD